MRMVGLGRMGANMAARLRSAGPVGGGHFAKMVHNGIEYKMMRTFGEGFATMERTELIGNPAEVMASWKSGSVVSSWLLDLPVEGMQSDSDLRHVPPVADESGEAKWMIEVACELGVPTPVTSSVLFARQASRGSEDDAMRVVTLLRCQFRGHVTSG